MKKSTDKSASYKKDSLSLIGAVALGTGVMIGAGIFSLTGQMAEVTGALFPFAFFSAAIVVSFSAYSYVKMSNAYPSAGGIAMYLHKAFGHSLTTAFHALLMYFSMVIAQSFLARTFGSYAIQLVDSSSDSIFVPVLGVGLLLIAFFVNLASNRLIEGVASIIGFIKIGGIVIFGLVGTWVAQQATPDLTPTSNNATLSGFLGATALGILAFKGFTTITNSGSELKNPHRNVGRAIIISITFCIFIYVLVGFAVANNLSLDAIVAAKNYSLAAAAKPALGNYGVWFTAILAMLATAGGIIASIFAVSRMLAMLTEMKLAPHITFGMSGNTQKHTLVYTVIIALFLTVFFDLTRIASLGIIFYLIMDIAVHWGILRYLRQDIKANEVILVTAILLDLIVLAGFIYYKVNTDLMVVIIAIVAMLIIGVLEFLFLKNQKQSSA